MPNNKRINLPIMQHTNIIQKGHLQSLIISIVHFISNRMFWVISSTVFLYYGFAIIFIFYDSLLLKLIKSIKERMYKKKLLKISIILEYDVLLFLLRFPPAFCAVLLILSLSWFSFVAVAVAGATTVFTTLKFRLTFVAGRV